MYTFLQIIIIIYTFFSFFTFLLQHIIVQDIMLCLSSLLSGPETILFYVSYLLNIFFYNFYFAFFTATTSLLIQQLVLRVICYQDSRLMQFLFTYLIISVSRGHHRLSKKKEQLSNQKKTVRVCPSLIHTYHLPPYPLILSTLCKSMNTRSFQYYSFF